VRYRPSHGVPEYDPNLKHQPKTGLTAGLKIAYSSSTMLYQLYVVPCHRVREGLISVTPGHEVQPTPTTLS